MLDTVQQRLEQASDSLRYMTEDAFPKPTGTTNKELFRIEGATPIQTYWVAEYVDAAVTNLAACVVRTL